MRLRADIWVAAYIRRCQTEGCFAVLRRRGSPEAGAIFVKIDRLDGSSALFSPASQSEVRDGYDRMFTRIHKAEWIESIDAEARMTREIGFDPDLWFVEVEDREGRSFLDLSK